jgi:hypothetical protein
MALFSLFYFLHLLLATVYAYDICLFAGCHLAWWAEHIAANRSIPYNSYCVREAYYHLGHGCVTRSTWAV